MKRLVLAVCCCFSIGNAADAQVCNALTATLTGTDLGEVIDGTEGNDVIFAGGGNDTINGNGGDDVICGGAGNDEISGGAGNDQLFGDDGDDTIIGGNDDDVLEGGADIDSCDGSVGIDSAAAECETVANVDVEIIPVTLFADDATQLDGALYRPFGDAGPLADPLVRGIHDLFQIMVREDLFGQIAAGTCNSRVDHVACLFS